VGYSFWWNGKDKPLSRREHLTRHGIYVEFLGLLGREIGLHFELHARFEKLKQNTVAYLVDAKSLLEEDLGACREIVTFINRLLSDYPQAADLPVAQWRAQYTEKIEQLLKALTGGS
ncbi:MAG: hypothetical protein K9N51_11025, partial [Candidatus Pacebacteria bacterium]|nr:hypothetical protein [Candidatus Paceibacterota bacterium]